jgi:hypothetical protein
MNMLSEKKKKRNTKRKKQNTFTLKIRQWAWPITRILKQTRYRTVCGAKRNPALSGV